MHIPLNKFPLKLRLQIVRHLQENNFPAAKQLRDEYEIQQRAASSKNKPVSERDSVSKRPPVTNAH